MYVARLIIVLFLLVMIIVAYSPQVREGLSQAWVEVRPVVVEIMDSLYATIRKYVAGSEPHDAIDDAPPGINYDFIITGKGAVSL